MARAAHVRHHREEAAVTDPDQGAAADERGGEIAVERGQYPRTFEVTETSLESRDIQQIDQQEGERPAPFLPVIAENRKHVGERGRGRAGAPELRQRAQRKYSAGSMP